MGGGGWNGLRSFRQDRSVLDHRVKKGTTRRILHFAVPYRRILAVFIPVVVLDAVVGAINPLILRAIIDKGILDHTSDLVVGLALVAAAWPSSAPCSRSTQRRISAVIGEGLIFDMRSKVFRHIQRMPLAFFTRTQTGALVSRLNNDVIGAQQAFTTLLSNVVGNLITVVIVLIAMFILSWQITLVALVLLPASSSRPASWAGGSGRSPRGLRPQRRDEHGHERAVQRLGRHAGQALRPARGRGRDFDRRPRGCATSASTRRCTRGCSSSPSPDRRAGHRLRLRLRRRRAAQGTMAVGTVVAITAYLARLYAPLTQLSKSTST